jgi:hypothetical protein
MLPYIGILNGKEGKKNAGMLAGGKILNSV